MTNIGETAATEPAGHDRSPPPIDLAWPLRQVVGAGFAVIVVLTIAQVFFRFVLDSPLIWSEEVARLLLVWVVFLGAAVVAWDGSHLNVDVVFTRLPARWRRWVRNLNLFLACGFAGLLAWNTIPLIKIESYVDMAAIGLPMSWLRAPAAIGGFLLVLALLLRRFYRLRGAPPSPNEPL